MRTLEVILKNDGSVVEERIDYHKAPDKSWRTVKTIRNVPRHDVQSLVLRVAEQVKILPRIIGPSIVDGETKSITVRVGKKKFVSGWVGYENTPSSPETIQFQNTWESLLSLLETPDA